MNVNNHLQKGFTLIELLTIVAIIGLLAAISGSAFILYRQNAAMAVMTQLYSDSKQDVESAIAVPDRILPSFSDVSQSESGPVLNASAREVLPAIQIPRKISYTVTFDGTCDSELCISTYIEIHYSSSNRYLTAIRSGDGLWIPVEHSS